MNEFNIYYKALKAMRLETLDNLITTRKRNILKNLNLLDESLVVTRYYCEIEDEWIKEIESKLEYLQKAVEENRQFIKSEGEVVPIEKAKKVSKDSVVHLAKHSNLITREQDLENIIPDSIFMVEKLSDYAVYENRFLYMVICYLRDFINIRLEKIELLRKTYEAKLNIKKELKDKNEFVIDLNMYEKRIDSPYLIFDERSSDLIRRINEITQVINMLLNTELMQQVSKSPMLKPPIIKTNVIKMNNNFKNILLLYDFLASYSKDGYKKIEVVKKFNPFNDQLSDEYLDIINMISFIAFKHGNDIENILEEDYKAELKRLKELEQIRLKEYIQRLKKRLEEDGSCLEEYINALETRNKELELEEEELKLARIEIINLKNEINTLNNEKKDLINKIYQLEIQIEEKISEIININKNHLKEISDLKAQHILEINDLNNKHEIDIINKEKEINLLYVDRLNNLNNEIIELNIKHKEEIQEYDSNINNLNNLINTTNETCETKIKEYEKKIKDSYEIHKQEIDELYNDIKFKNAHIDALRAQTGEIKPSVELTSEEKFKELEDSFLFLNEFFKKQWKLTRKEIRKQILWSKEEKKKR